jgi:hypothetical protein
MSQRTKVITRIVFALSLIVAGWLFMERGRLRQEKLLQEAAEGREGR